MTFYFTTQCEASFAGDRLIGYRPSPTSLSFAGDYQHLTPKQQELVVLLDAAADENGFALLGGVGERLYSRPFGAEYLFAVIAEDLTSK